MVPFHRVADAAINKSYPFYDKYTTVKLKNWTMGCAWLFIGFHSNITSSKIIYVKGLLGILGTEPFSILYSGWGFDAPSIEGVISPMLGFSGGILLTDNFDLGFTYLESEPTYAIKSTIEDRVTFSQKISTIQVTFGYRWLLHR